MQTEPIWIALSNVLLHGIERLIIAGGGVLLVYLGYKLFVQGVSGAASLSLDRNRMRFQLLNAAPGTFFALFGCTLMSVGILRGVWYSYEFPMVVQSESSTNEQTAVSDAEAAAYILEDRSPHASEPVASQRSSPSAPKSKPGMPNSTPRKDEMTTGRIEGGCGDLMKSFMDQLDSGPVRAP